MTEQPGKGRDGGNEPRTDLPPKKEPYYDGYFGSDEEEGVERSTQDPGEREREGPGGEGESDRP